MTNTHRGETEVDRLREENRHLRSLLKDQEQTAAVLAASEEKVAVQKRQLAFADADKMQQVRLFETILSSIVDFAYVFNREGRFTYVNQALLGLWQITLEDALGKNFFDLDYPETLAAQLQRQIQTVFETGQPLRDETSYTAASGIAGYYEYIFVPVFGPDEQVEAVAGSTRDITARHAEQRKKEAIVKALEVEQARLTSLFMQAPAFITILRGPQHVFEMANPFYHQLIGPQRDIIGKPIREALPEVEGQGFFEILDEVYRTGKPFMGTATRIWLRDKPDAPLRERYLDFVYQPLVEAEGSVSGIFVHGVDLTEHKHAEEALRASEERYRLTVEGALEYAIILYDAQGRCTGWSRGAARIFGYVEEEALGQYTDFVFTPEDRAAGVPLAERETARREGRMEDERWHVRKDGSRFFASGVMMALWGEAGAVRGYVKVARDLTEQRQMEVALRASEERYRLTVENIHDYAIFTLDTQGYITSWNEGARRVKGYEAHEVLEQHLRLFYTPEDQQAGRPEQEMEHARQTGRNEDENWRVRKDGTRFWVNEIMTAMHDETGALWGFVKISRDMTERKRAEEEHLAFERETTLLTERNRMAQELHDTLAQGFTGIKMQMEMAQSALQATPPEVEEGVQRVVRATEIARQSHQEARRSIRALRSPLLENATLVA